MKEFKPVVSFILKFLAVSFLLLMVYNHYLSVYHSQNLPDPYSEKVAGWSVALARSFGFLSKVQNDNTQPWIWIYTEGQRTSYINEGCNAVSVMMIFTAFIVAFPTAWKKTLLYILAGLMIIQIMNVMRIFLLNYIFRYYPEYGKAAHDYLFPAIIYGTIFFLWVVWVTCFVLKKTKVDEPAI